VTTEEFHCTAMHMVNGLPKQHRRSVSTSL
jgi:hypothetical protein